MFSLQNDLDDYKYLRFSLISSCVIAIIIACLGLAGYIPGFRILGSVSEDYIPMAPSTAVSFILLSSFLLAQYIRTGSQSKLSLIFRSVSLFVAIFGLLKFLEFFFELELTFEKLIIPVSDKLGDVPIGIMSPATGLGFFLSGLASFLIMRNKNSSLAQHSIGVLGSIIVFFSTTFILGYLFRQPLLYDNSTVPMALTTSIAFMFLGFGIVLSIGKDHFPMSLISGPSTRSKLFRNFIPFVIVLVLLPNITYFIFSINFFQINSALWTSFFLMISLLAATGVIFWISKRISINLDTLDEKMKRAKLLLESSLDSFLGSIVLMIDKEYNYLYFNNYHKNTMEIVYGNTPELGMKIFDCMNVTEDIILAKDHYDRALSGDSHLLIDEFGDPDNRLYYETLYNTIYDLDKNVIGVSAFAREVTERENHKNEIQKLNEELEHKVDKRTEELKSKVTELQNFYNATIDRELRMHELREENKRLNNLNSE